MPLVRGSGAADVPSSDSCCGSRPRCPAPTHELTATHGIIRALSDDGLRGTGPVQLCTVNRLTAPGEGLHQAMELDTRVAHSALPFVTAAERAVNGWAAFVEAEAFRQQRRIVASTVRRCRRPTQAPTPTLPGAVFPPLPCGAGAPLRPGRTSLGPRKPAEHEIPHRHPAPSGGRRPVFLVFVRRLCTEWHPVPRPGKPSIGCPAAVYP